LSSPTIAELQLKNNYLRQLVMLLGRMFLISAAEQREARAERGAAIDGSRILSMMGIQTITHLRLVASHCAQLGGVGGDQGIARELETLAAEIADEVDKLEAAFGSGK
jgi:hypothetical protein